MYYGNSLAIEKNKSNYNALCFEIFPEGRGLNDLSFLSRL